MCKKCGREGLLFSLILAMGRVPKWQTIVKGSLEEILPSYENLRSVCAYVRDTQKGRLTIACVGTLGAARFRRGCGAVSALTPVEIEA